MAIHWFPLAILTALLWGIVPFFEKTAMNVVPNGLCAVTIRSFGAALGMMIPLFSEPTRTSLSSIPPLGYLFLIVAGFIGSVLGQLTYLTAMKMGEVSRVTPVAASWIIVSLIVAAVFLKEPLSLKKILAVSLVVSGVVLLKTD